MLTSLHRVLQEQVSLQQQQQLEINRLLPACHVVSWPAVTL